MTDRRAAIALVLDHARAHPQGGLGYDDLPAVRRAFATRRELVLALELEWSRLLWATIEVTLRRPRGGGVEIAWLAWGECAARHPVLRRLLDEPTHSPAAVSPSAVATPSFVLPGWDGEGHSARCGPGGNPRPVGVRGGQAGRAAQAVRA